MHPRKSDHQRPTLMQGLNTLGGIRSIPQDSFEGSLGHVSTFSSYSEHESILGRVKGPSSNNIYEGDDSFDSARDNKTADPPLHCLHPDVYCT